MEKSKVNVNEILEAAAKTSAAAVEAAKAEMLKRQQEQEIQRVVSQLQEIEERVKFGIVRLRQARQTEKAATSYLKDLVRAKEQFMLDADYSKFEQAKSDADCKWRKNM